MKVKKIDLKQAKREFQRKLDLILKGEKTASAIAKEENLSRPEARRLYLASVRASVKKKPRYNNHSCSVTYRGQQYNFPSKLEAGHFKELCLRQDAGEIRDLRCQEDVYLTEARIHFIPDFSYVVCATGEKEFYESKGLELERFQILKKLWPYYSDHKLTIDFGKGRIKEIFPIGAKKRRCSLCGK